MFSSCDQHPTTLDKLADYSVNIQDAKEMTSIETRAFRMIFSR